MGFAKPKYAKVGALGFQGSGKTFESLLLACGLHKKIGSNRPIRIFDTEGGISYQLERIRALTGMEPEGEQRQSFVDLMAFTRTCQEGDIVMVDSVTHPWAELLRAAKTRAKGLRAIGIAKDEWAPFTQWVLGSPCHVFICGRAGYDFDQEEDEHGHKEMVKTGTRMKTEGEFGYEPSLLLEMIRAQSKDGVIEHEILVKKDRFALLDGRSFLFGPDARVLSDLAYNPVFKVFEPWFDKLDLSVQGAPSGLDISDKTATILDANGDGEYRREQTARAVLLDQIANDLFLAYPGQGAEAKSARLRTTEEIFGTTSWEALDKNFENRYHSSILRAGRVKLLEKINAKKEESNAVLPG
jgi:hypothetical protein